MRSAPLLVFSFLGNQSNRLNQGRAKQTRSFSFTGSTGMTTAVSNELEACSESLRL